jgi:HPt (histidine-containing phosphotransfer) domain-containing protein
MAEPILNQFMKDAPLTISQINAALNASKYPEFLDLVHGLKGMCATVSAGKMKQTCIDLERTAQDGTWDKIPPILQRLDCEMLEIKRANDKP